MAWYDGLGDVSAVLDCHGERHRVRWHRGRLQLEDHPDPGAEVVLAALGAPMPACVQLLDLWREAISDGGFLSEWAQREHVEPGRRGQLEVALIRLRREGVQDLLPELDIRRAERMGVMLARFPSDLVERAALAVARRLVRRSDLPRHELGPWLAHAIRVRARSAFVRSLADWRTYARPAALVPFHCAVGVGVTPAASGQLHGRASFLEVLLDARWLLDVWARGMAIDDGSLVLDAERGPGGRWSVLSVDWRAGPGGGLVAAPSWRRATGRRNVAGYAGTEGVTARNSSNNGLSCSGASSGIQCEDPLLSS
jgi:hypothetical protein